MAGEGTGAVSSIRMKQQTAVDTIPTSALRNLPFSNVEVRVVSGGDEESSHLGANAATDAIYLSPSYHEIDYDFDLGYTGGLIDVLGAIVGSPTVAGDNSAAAKNNTFVPSASPNYRYMQIVEGDLPTTKAQGYRNALCVDATIAWGSDSPKGTVKSKWVAQSNCELVGGGTTPTTGEALVTGSLVAVSHIPILANQWTIWNLGVGTNTGYCVSSVAVKLSREYDAKRSCIGRTSYKPAIYTGPLRPSVEVEFEYDDAAMFAAVIAQTVLTALDFKAVGGLTGVASDPYSLEVRSNKAVGLNWSLPINSNGRIKQKLTIKGYGNTGSGQSYEAINFKTVDKVDGATL